MAPCTKAQQSELTREQFNEVGKAVIDDDPDNYMWSLRQVSDALMDELTKRYGQPRI